MPTKWRPPLPTTNVACTRLLRSQCWLKTVWQLLDLLSWSRHLGKTASDSYIPILSFSIKCGSRFPSTSSLELESHKHQPARKKRPRAPSNIDPKEYNYPFCPENEWSVCVSSYLLLEYTKIQYLLSLLFNNQSNPDSIIISIVLFCFAETAVYCQLIHVYLFLAS